MEQARNAWTIRTVAGKLTPGARFAFAPELGGEGQVLTVESVTGLFGTVALATEELDFELDRVGPLAAGYPLPRRMIPIKARIVLLPPLEAIMTASRVPIRKTPEERRAQAEALQASIAEQVEQLRGSEQWQRFLDFARSFHGYSLPNLLLILDQCPTATRVAGFRQWQEKGRQVRKGEKAIRIFGFRQKKVTDEETPEGEESGEANDKGWR